MAVRAKKRRKRWAVVLAHLLQAALAWPLYKIVKQLPLDQASALCGWTTRTIGPRLGTTRRAVSNLNMIFPGIEPARVEAIVTGMWDNLGRVASEYIHLETLVREHERIEIIGGEILDRLQVGGRPMLLFAGHLANWEVATVAARRHGLPLSVVYRNFNNPYFDHYIRGMQRGSGVELIRKGAAGARRLIHELREGRHTIMLVDQRMNDGIPVPFFGRDAMTAPAIAELAYKYDAAIVPVHVERLCGARFRVTVEPPLPLEDSGDRRADVARTMALVNQRIEAWVRERPEQWLWLHRRWPDSTRSGWRG